VTFSLYRTRLPPPLCVHTSHRICQNLRIESRPSRAGWGPTAPYASRGDANENASFCQNAQQTSCNIS